jgi:thermitase
MKKIIYLSIALPLLLMLGIYIFYLSNSNSTVAFFEKYTKQNVKPESTKNSENSNNQEKQNVEKGTSIVAFETAQQKDRFLLENKIDTSKLKQIPNTNNYQINIDYDELKNLKGYDEIKVFPNIIYKASATPNDPLYSQQWNLTKISAPTAWDISKSSSATKIAVIDTGFAINHQDLVNKLDLASGYDFANNDSDVSAGSTNINGSFVYHGTAAASLAGAETNNSLGIASLGWDSKIIPVQSLNDDGLGNTFTVAAGIYHAVDNGAKVISMSLGSTASDSFLNGAINYAISNNVVVVAASGNDSCNCINYPANIPSVIAVGASDASDNRASFSNYGNNLDVVAPGSGGVRAATMNSSNQTSLYTTSFSGTSSSTPQVAALAALIKTIRPTSTPSEVESYIRSGADKTSAMAGQNFTTSYGYGRINATNSLVQAGAYSWQIQSQSSDKNLSNLARGEKANITIIAKNTGTQTWSNSGQNPIKLATYSPQDRISSFQTSAWQSSGRPALLVESQVLPGDNGTFQFEIQSGSATGQYNEKFNLLAENLAWFNDAGLNIPINLVSPNISAETVTNTYSASMISLATSSSNLTIKNTGNVTWYKTGTFTADLYTNPYNTTSPFQDSSWLNSQIVARMQEESVAPGGNATFSFGLKAPKYNGVYSVQFRLGITNLGWSSLYPTQNITVTGGETPNTPVYRHYSPSRGSHFYTTDLNESNIIRSQGWNYEGVAWYVLSTPNSKPVYRHYSPSRGRHFYTTSLNESNTIRSQGWNYEGVAWYASETPTSYPVYRHYSPTRRAHFYTRDSNESNIIRSQGWGYEGIEYYAF